MTIDPSLIAAFVIVAFCIGAFVAILAIYPEWKRTIKEQQKLIGELLDKQHKAIALLEEISDVPRTVAQATVPRGEEMDPTNQAHRDNVVVMLSVSWDRLLRIEEFLKSVYGEDEKDDQ